MASRLSSSINRMQRDSDNKKRRQSTPKEIEFGFETLVEIIEMEIDDYQYQIDNNTHLTDRLYKLELQMQD